MTEIWHGVSKSGVSRFRTCERCKWWKRGLSVIVGDCTLFSSRDGATVYPGVLAGAYGDDDGAAHLETDQSFGCVSFEEAK